MEPGPKDWLRIKEVFEAALPMAPDERRAYVVAACGADQALADRIGKLLATHYRSAVERRDVLLALFPAWVPDLDPLRADPRFPQLMQCFNARS